MKRLALALAVASSTVVLVATAQADPSEYRIESAAASTSIIQAGGHPDFSVSLTLKKDAEGDLPSTTRDLSFELPPGLLANPGAVPQCTAAQFITTDVDDPSNTTGCPQASQVGVTEVELFKGGELLAPIFEPVYNLQPGYGEPARFGFFADVFPVMIDTELRSGGPDPDYGATATVQAASALVPILSANTTFWGTPAAESHDAQRFTAYEAVHNNGAPETPNGKRSSGLVPVPYMLNPTRCGTAQGVSITAVPYALPDLEAKAFAPLPANTGCSLLNFEPDLSLTPTSSQAESGSGLDAELTLPTDGLEHPNLLAEAEPKKAEVALPEGVTVNPSQAVGLGVCSEADFAAETASSGPDQGCPETSKIGSVTATSPLVDQSAEGGLYVATPYQNPFGTLIALYLVLKIPDRGVIVKLPAKVTADPQTGQLLTTFGEAPDEIPQLPISSFHLHFREGARSPLVTPPHCGSFESTATFTSWAGQVRTTHPSFEVTRGVNGGPCPSGGLPPFNPGLIAGSVNDTAGAYSPFYVRLTREDSEQEITHFSIKLPPGVTGKLAGIPYCPDADIAAAVSRERQPHGGQEELEHPSCPQASEVGHTLVGAGVGPSLTYVPGKVYLAGPYNGAPLSIVAITAAKAGPFDLGTVVVREALRVNPETAEVSVDATGSDPIPHIVNGIPVHLRDIRVYVDRPEFVLNPTNCEPTSTASTVLGSGTDFASEADDRPVTVTTRFQAADCASLGFAPSLKLQLKGGGTGRGGLPALKAVLTARKGDANIGKAQVTLPPSEFLEQGHLKNVCPRSVWIQGTVPGEKCPASSIYGHAKAITPLLSEPLTGPVYLRTGYGTRLPQMVAALNGQQINVDVVGEIDSVHKKGSEVSLLRNTFKTVPDAPVTRFELALEGGKKSLLVNSTNICKGTHKATALFTGQNGKRHEIKPKLQVTSCGKHRKGRKKAVKKKKPKADSGTARPGARRRRSPSRHHLAPGG